MPFKLPNKREIVAGTTTMPSRRLLIFILVFLVFLQVCVVTHFYMRPTPQDSQMFSTKIDLVGSFLELAALKEHVVNDSNNSTSVHDYNIVPNTHKLLQNFKESISSQEHVFEKPLNVSAKIQDSKLCAVEKPSNPLASGQTWRKNGFCYDFLVNTFREDVSLCSTKTSPVSHSIQCFGNPDSEHMATCTLRNVVIRPSLFAKAMFDADNTNFVQPSEIQLLNDTNTACVNPSAHDLERKMEYGDYVLTLTRQVASNPQISSQVCQRWVNHTVFFFTAHGYHVYFRFLDYYNLHKSILDSNERPGEYEIIRISEGEHYHFSDFDVGLFSNFTNISSLKDVNTCFRKVIMVPKCYASVFFQCKMQYEIQDLCFECDGKGLQGTPFVSFQRRVLAACGIDPDEKEQEKLVLISRKPYIRSNDDSLDKFQRVLQNEDELVKTIQYSLPNVNVTDLQFENLHICDQIRHVRSSHVLMGVHGAGLVHSWWLRDDALAFELEPFYQAGNPSFRMLTKLTGRNYHSVSIDGGFEYVSADIDLVIADLKHKGGFHNNN